MPQIGWFEILIVVILAILIIGPKDFPIMLKSIGSWISSLKKYFNEIQKDIVSLENPIDEKIYMSTESYTDNGTAGGFSTMSGYETTGSQTSITSITCLGNPFDGNLSCWAVRN